MAPKGGKLKRFLLIMLFLVLVAVAFVLLGGGNLLKSAGTKAENIKGQIEESAKTVEKKAEKVKEAVTSAGEKVEKKAERVKDAVTSGEK
jgi:F0F1-type ATP synthase membrane subunit b/b'